MMKKIALALLLVSLALASERVVFYGGDASAKSLFDEWGVLAALLLAAGIFLTALVYMLGNFLMNEKIKDWAKTEAVELFYSGVLLAMIVSVYVGGNEAADALTRQFDQYSADLVCAKDTVFTTFTYENDAGESVSVDSVPYKYLPACHLKIAKNFMASLFYEVAGFVKAVGITHSWYTYWSSLGVDFGPVGSIAYFAGGSLSIAPFGYMNAKNNALAFLFENGVKVLMLVRFQEILINFVGSALFPVLLMSGLILRTFMVTRKLGGLLMALALSLYFIFPLFYVLGDMVYTSIILANYDPSRPPEEKPALAQIFVDLDSLPKKINGTYQENSSLNTDGSNASKEFLKQLGLLTATEACNKTLQDVESEQSEWGSIAKYANLTKIWEKFSGGNTLLGTWLSGLYGKGGWSDSFPGISSPIATAMNTASFDSILDGIDVLAKAIFFSMFFSFLSIFATIAAVKSLSPMLGGDVEIAGLTHLI